MTRDNRCSPGGYFHLRASDSCQSRLGSESLAHTVESLGGGLIWLRSLGVHLMMYVEESVLVLISILTYWQRWSAPDIE